MMSPTGMFSRLLAQVEGRRRWVHRADVRTLAREGPRTGISLRYALQKTFGGSGNVRTKGL